MQKGDDALIGALDGVLIGLFGGVQALEPAFGIALQEGQCDLAFDSKTDVLMLQAIESTLIYKDKPYRLTGQ
ncbi:MAG: hypothetical protein M0T83_06665, partial [Nitrospiraceae bacterium]|nr:hypothetical protein [Nitrospiraceae bacterium]